jgi:hypothetical protein
MGAMSSGVASRQQIEAAEARAQAAIAEALGSANLAHLSAADVEAVHTRLESMRASGRVTGTQYTALVKGLAVFSQSAPG